MAGQDGAFDAQVLVIDITDRDDNRSHQCTSKATLGKNLSKKRRWTKDQDTELLNMREERVSFRKISEHLSRTPAACATRFYSVGGAPLNPRRGATKEANKRRDEKKAAMRDATAELLKLVELRRDKTTIIQQGVESGLSYRAIGEIVGLGKQAVFEIVKRARRRQSAEPIGADGLPNHDG